MMNEQILEKLDNIESYMRNQSDNQVWDLEQIGLYLKLAPETVRKHTSRKGFPRPCSFSKSRWPAKEVKAWALKQA